MAVHIIMVADHALEDWVEPQTIIQRYSQDSDEIRVIYVSQGMESGAPSCMIVVKSLDTKEITIIELSAEMLQSIAGSFRGRKDFEDSQR